MDKRDIRKIASGDVSLERKQSIYCAQPYEELGYAKLECIENTLRL